MSLTHQQAQTYVEQSLDGRLSPSAQNELEQHLHHCGRCRQYAVEAAQFDAHLARSLGALWPRQSASPARLAETVDRARGARPDRGRWASFAKGGRLVLQVAAVLLLIVAAAWILRAPSGELEEVAYSNGFFQRPELADQYIAVHFQLDTGNLPGEAIEVYYPICDGVEYFPPAGSLASKLARGEPLPECEIRPSTTFLLSPGEAREVLFVYRNPAEEDLTFRILPTTRVSALPNSAVALCGPAAATNDSFSSSDCTSYQAPAEGVWAKFITFHVAPDAVPGSHVNVAARIEWEWATGR